MSDSTIIQTRVPRDFAQRVKSHARSAERTVSAEVRFALRELLNDNDPASTPGRVEESAGQGRHGES